MSIARIARNAGVALLLAWPCMAAAEPYLAVQQGYECGMCHVNPTGGGLRNEFGTVFSENTMPAMALPQNTPTWSGKVGDFVRLGGNLRASGTSTDVPDQDEQHEWDLDQLRVYVGVDVIPERLALVIDESLAPGNAEVREAYVRYSHSPDGFYLKGGQFYLPFGWRLEDQAAFVRQVSGINMTTPDEGVELGWERGAWSTQLVLSNGAANAGSGSGEQVTAQAVWTQTRGRLGLAASHTNTEAGDRDMVGLFGGLRTGPVAWLGEADYVQDEGFPEGTRSMLVGLAEADWAVAKGHNLKLTAEYYDPDDDVDEDQKTRWSLVYEFTPLPFVQLRAGARQYDGIPQNDLDNRRVLFLELHGFF
jgi:hypothetical protein